MWWLRTIERFAGLVCSRRCGADAGPMRGRCGADAGPMRFPAAAFVVRVDSLADTQRVVAARGTPAAILLQVDAAPAWALWLVQLSMSHAVPIVLCMGDSASAIGDLRTLFSANPRMLLLQSPLNRVAARFGRMLEIGVPLCATGRMLAAMPVRGDRVTQAMVTHVVVASRLGVSVREVACTHRLSTSAVRARFAASGLVSPRMLIAGTRAVHALWYIVERRQPAERVAHRLRFGTVSNLLERIRVGTGRSLRAWKRDGGFTAALESVLVRVVP
jgi:AraC-like DNA-binding protein